MAEEEQMNDLVMADDVPPPPEKKVFPFDFGKPRHKWSIIPESKLIFIIRIGGENKSMCPSLRKLLYSLRLQKLNTGVFVKADESMMAIIRKLKPFVTYGYPPLCSVKTITNTAVVKLGKRFTLLKNSNDVVVQAFGKYNMNCIEDVVNEISNVGPHFKDVVTAIAPIIIIPLKKNRSKGNKEQHNDGGDAGNRQDQDHIVELICKMKMT